MQNVTCGAGEMCFVPPIPDLVQQQCRQCVSGTYSVPGQWADQANPQCAGSKRCGAGYAATDGATDSVKATCKQCDAMTYAASNTYCYPTGIAGATTLWQEPGIPCPPPSPTYKHGYSSVAGENIVCLPCPPGTVSEAGASECSNPFECNPTTGLCEPNKGAKHTQNFCNSTCVATAKPTPAPPTPPPPPPPTPSTYSCSKLTGNCVPGKGNMTNAECLSMCVLTAKPTPAPPAPTPPPPTPGPPTSEVGPILGGVGGMVALAALLLFLHGRSKKKDGRDSDAYGAAMDEKLLGMGAPLAVVTKDDSPEPIEKRTTGE